MSENSNNDSSSNDGHNNGHNNGHNASNGKEKINYKARLEHKQYLTQESPEPVYDISECGLKAVPSGVYSKCKVLRKEALLLQNNELTCLNGGGGVLADMSSVLQVLDLHANKLEKLPEEIGLLKELRVLYIHRNKLKKLPESLGDLKKLQSLDVSHNNLKDLPVSLSQLLRLRTLDLSANPKLTRLNKSLANARSLEKIILDVQSFQYPSPSICQEGTEAIARFLCKECDIEYIPPSEYHPPAETGGPKTTKNGFDDDPYDRIVRGSLKILEKQKEDKKKNMILMQKDMEDNQAKEALLAASVKDMKRKLLYELANDEAKRDEAVKRLQALKEKEKENLVNSLFNTENVTDALISELVKANNQLRADPQRVLEELEKERKEMEEMFQIKAGEEGKLREQEIKKEMQRIMEEEMKREQVRRSYEAGRKDIINNALVLNLENDRAVDNVLDSKGKQQKEMISNLLEDEKYQREAFTALFLKQDGRHKEISNQVEQIQNELANLTMIEMTKKDLKMEFEKDVMAEKRETLSAMLMQLMNQKEERAKELQNRLKELDQNRNEETDNFWLIQYQKLLDSKPKKILEAEKNIDADLKEVLTKAGAEDFIPVFSLKKVNLKQLVYMKDKELAEELGIHNTYLRQKILMTAEEYMKQQQANSGFKVPSAPPISGEPSAPPLPSSSGDNSMISTKYGKDAPSAPSAPSAPNAPNAPNAPSAPAPASAPPVETFQSNECVVCLEKKCDIIFLPCGHVCCCSNCEKDVSTCPLCRAAINQKVHLQI